jgi:hypothetical protein
MNCSSEDLKGYFLGELASREKASVEDHLHVCQSCREDLDRLKVTQTALLALEEEEVPQRIAFVSDKVFEPRWYETIWRSGPAMGFASAALLAAAILVHGYARPAVAPPIAATVDTAQIEQRIEREVNARLDTVVQKAVSDAEAKQAAEFTKVLDASEARFETRRKADLATIQQAAEYYEKQMNRWLVASNDTRAGQ